ncbi:hypothetical protein HOY82DRAFT_573327 [Tuber indicum]|nr:hypothetical protein HOY82DRAFT_573327 [Tuber indicum]
MQLQPSTQCVHWFRRERFLKITMPTKLHESASAWLYGEISKGLATGTLPYAWIIAITISGSPEPEADMTIVPLLGPDWTKDREFPTLQVGSDGAVRIVIQVKFYSRWGGERIGSRMWISRARPTKNSFKRSCEQSVLPAVPSDCRRRQSTTVG